MPKFTLSERSRKNMIGIDPSLIVLIEKTIQDTPYDFIVTEGLRTLARQKELVAAKKSQTLKSKHIVGRAFDIAVVENGKVTWVFDRYKSVATAFKKKAQELNISIEWGGDWVSFKDGPHFQLKD